MLVLGLGAVLGYSLYHRHVHLHTAVATSVAGVVSLIPEGLVLLVGVTYAAAPVRMSRHGVLAQQLNAIESLASVDPVCLDKTGTLTEAALRVVEVVPAAGVAEERVRTALGDLAVSASARNTTLQAIAAGAESWFAVIPAATPDASIGRPAVRRGLLIGWPHPRSLLAVLARPPAHIVARAHWRSARCDRNRRRDRALPDTAEPALAQHPRQRSRSAIALSDRAITHAHVASLAVAVALPACFLTVLLAARTQSAPSRRSISPRQDPSCRGLAAAPPHPSTPRPGGIPRTRGGRARHHRCLPPGRFSWGCCNALILARATASVVLERVCEHLQRTRDKIGRAHV